MKLSKKAGQLLRLTTYVTKMVAMVELKKPKEFQEYLNKYTELSLRVQAKDIIKIINGTNKRNIAILRIKNKFLRLKK